MKKEVHVVGAVIQRDGLILCAKRGPTGSLPHKWEFPGGKIEPDESSREALIREIDEELECVVEVGERITTTRYEYDFAVVVLTTYFCRLVSGEPVLTEHAEVAWYPKQELRALDWAPADIPAIHLIEGSVQA
ncbi:MAG: (deoxy)nucleoside triphosphate pyrophosphohydrolase [Nesterenkonia sp.]|uniref:(deoxy)nucleoside triphosphate pyrophosphohydrolase n=1 Tax=Nesterenkonia marinintestina TaxID=2979865 RepID=UPI0021BF918D|nr:(deoxy)nucleoside triphosphate pyrophosphohydrolase [Nesterenkonia sp. GX14115]MDO5492618.1 (deoxy)nucleoside triphosphate pyrophosphohydrolase [Nesterenkonia sp.]